ncbi:MAG: phosphatidate cytidylyltransferase, partial [Bacillota bacterium]
KDLGSSIPGHGGLLDRVDSLALTSMVFFYAINLMH